MIRSGIGFDSHRFEAGRTLVLGGVEIPAERGLAGHSDADALSHALVDALLGAAALGDIGAHFPDDDPRWKDADSRLFLRETLALLAAAGYRPVNVDATVITEAPRLGEHVPAIRESLAETLRLPVDRVSVKAKSAESMGSLGRGEGLAVLALATVEEVAGD